MAGFCAIVLAQTALTNKFMNEYLKKKNETITKLERALYLLALVLLQFICFMAILFILALGWAFAGDLAEMAIG